MPDTSLPYPEDEYDVPHAEAAAYLGIPAQNLYSRVTYGSISRLKLNARDDNSSPIYYSYYHPEELRLYKERRASRPYQTCLTQEQEDRVVLLYTAGQSIGHIRHELHIGQTKIYKILATHQIPIRPPTKPSV